MIFPLVLAELGTLHADVAMQPRSVSRPTGLPTLNLPRRSGRIRNAVNGVRPRMRQMDVWSRDHRRPIEQEEKDRVAAGWYTSPDSEPRVRSAPAGDVPPTSRRVAHSRNVPASAPSEDDEKVGGRFSDGSIPGGYGKSPFSLDCTYHGSPHILYVSRLFQGLGHSRG